MTTFSKKIIHWHSKNGRHDLPWQKNTTPYRVWVSEIMLQQTQVTTVIPYYLKFMQRFANLKQLATAPIDDVLSHWSGLGYYARARNLHKTATLLYEENRSRFPRTQEELIKLPGIGRSTAGAILSFAHDLPAVILDGNVKRVLSRHSGITEWPGNKHVHDSLWELATKLTPQKNTAIYNQAMMDVGSLICTRSSPACARCPVQSDCAGLRSGKPTQYPGKKPKTKKRRHEKTYMLLLCNRYKEVLLMKRPEKGIWGGLWSFPEAKTLAALQSHWRKQVRLSSGPFHRLQEIKHSFSHYDLTIQPIIMHTSATSSLQPPAFCWHDLSHNAPGGVAAPVQKLFNTLKEITHD